MQSRDRQNPKWYVTVYHCLTAVLCTLIPLGLLAVSFFQPRAMAISALLLFLLACPLLGYIATSILRDAPWRTGCGTNRNPLLSPPSQLNCVLMACLGITITGIGIEELVAQRNLILFLTLVPAGIFVVVLSVSGFLWSRDRRRRCG